MMFANAGKLNRKSGVRLGERGAPVRFPLAFGLPVDCLEVEDCLEKDAAVAGCGGAEEATAGQRQ
jgi:hypothetical protein